jgi:hypothetical protein
MNKLELELLTYAAKAAGLALDRYYEGRQGEFADGLICKGCPTWNPLKDDAQCLQLARKLGINLDYTSDKCAWKRVRDEMYQEYFDQDGWHATDREAVVTVAARMGGWVEAL